MRSGRGRSWALLLLFGALLLAGATAGISRSLGEAVLDEPAPTWFGSRPETLARVSPIDCDAYSFVVLGDIQQGLKAFQRGLAFAEKTPGVAFAVACGDLVNNPTEPHYRLLFSAAADAAPGMPVFTVPGNHDGPETYEAHLGPTPWSARVGPDLLVGLDNGGHVPDAAELAAVEPLLIQEGVRHRFVFLHRPYMKGDRVRPGFEPLFKMLTRCGVDAIFAGHTHRYERDQRDGVLHVSNGMGGDRSHDTDGTAIVTLVSVSGNGFLDRAVTLGRHSEILSHIEDSLVAHLYAPVRGRWTWIASVLALLTLGLLLGQLVLGRGAILPTLALFAPALAPAPPPSGPLLLVGYAALGVAVLLSLRPGRLERIGLWLGMAAVLLLARSPFLAATAIVLTGLVMWWRPGLLGRPLRPAVATRSIVVTILLIAAWSGSYLLLPALSSAAALPLLRR